MFIKRISSNNCEPINDFTQFLTNASKRQISNLAEEVYELGKDIKEVIDTLGGKVSKVELKNKEISNSVFVFDRNKFEIKVSNIGDYRENFILLHRLGHYALHTNFGRKVAEMREKDRDLEAIVFKRYESNPLEWEADWFAGAFLMPEEKFRELNERYQDDYILSAVFGVSALAVRVRKQVLGLD
jgi:Zn-dependent peptidase ImmA (M78 family)